MTWLLLIGLALLVTGAEFLVRGSAAIAKRLGLSELLIGLTVVSFGTSAPELAVSIRSGIAGQDGVALGNVIGSNLFNILAVAGIPAMVSPLSSQGIGTVDLVAMILALLALIPLAWTGARLNRIEGEILLLGYAAYLWVMWPA